MQIIKELIAVIAPKEMFTLNRVLGAIAGAVTFGVLAKTILTFSFIASVVLPAFAGALAFNVVSRVTRVLRDGRAA
ncbi:hypothetical protein G6L37_11780 [Agrobacterium rubi]|uniref:hypothetical protein n=1 Tax=Agrobacterium rubi TaxID=28099 RepID=UPI00157253A5|nr:hypothetical protein [Agrobacterium rubi]NTF06841.1 hypothetical protein [Agrobacterium rubi]NTF19083.1 hypothetical protein [Agrobacterium rubi]NTF26046.1 hypothetical protein [Agrobacterium rubi]